MGLERRSPEGLTTAHVQVQRRSEANTGSITKMAMLRDKVDNASADAPVRGTMLEKIRDCLRLPITAVPILYFGSYVVPVYLYRC